MNLALTSFQFLFLFRSGGDKLKHYTPYTNTTHLWIHQSTVSVSNWPYEGLPRNDAPPKTLAELNDRVKQARGQQKVFWQEMAGKMSDKFEETFDNDRGARKWGT